MNISIQKSLLAAAGVLAMLSGPAQAINGSNTNAMTWGAVDIPGVTNIAVNPSTDMRKVVVVGCHAANGSCNPHVGDASETDVHPILCFVPDSIPEPAPYAAYFQANFNPAGKASSNWRFYHGWSGGQVGATRPIPASLIPTKAQADAACAGPIFGLNDPNARMLEFHDNGVGGWGLGGVLHENSHAKQSLRNPGVNPRRYWTYINDQSSNPWN